jgi:hypothetical protein
MATERTPYEITLGIPVRCIAVFRLLKSAFCPRPDGWWTTDAMLDITSHGSDSKKARELAIECPDVVERKYLDRKDGEIKDTLEECGQPIAMYRLSAKYDPRRAPDRAAAMQGVLL